MATPKRRDTASRSASASARRPASPCRRKEKESAAADTVRLVLVNGDSLARDRREHDESGRKRVRFLALGERAFQLGQPWRRVHRARGTTISPNASVAPSSWGGGVTAAPIASR